MKSSAAMFGPGAAAVFGMVMGMLTLTAWPPRLHDVQETETMLINEQQDLRRLEEERKQQEANHV